MSVTLSTIVRPAVAKRHGAFSRVLGAFCHRIAAYFVHRAAVKSLSEFDDRALSDIGIDRSQIEAAVCGLLTLPRSSEALMATSAATESQTSGHRRASTAEAASWT